LDPTKGGEGAKENERKEIRMVKGVEKENSKIGKQENEGNLERRFPSRSAEKKGSVTGVKQERGKE